MANNDPVLMLFEAVAYLHKQGYQKLRIMSFFSPSGCYFRVLISIKENFDKVTGFIIRKDPKYPIYIYTTGKYYRFFEDRESFEDKTVIDLARGLFEEYPDLEKLSKGQDPEYTSWFENVVEIARTKESYPYAFDDYGYDCYEEKRIKLTRRNEFIEYAPPGLHD